jgi:pyrroline-5-carboxylate reductase
MLKKKMILFLGAGSMSEAMISGIVKSELIPRNQITVSNQRNIDRLRRLEEVFKINVVKKNQLIIEQYDIIVLAMKPKDAETSFQFIKNRLQPHQLILSVIAGVTTHFMEQNLPTGQQVIRVMPNTSSMIGESATAIATGSFTTKNNLNLAEELFQCIGKVYFIPEEKMDLFTGLAGSGPAYFYYLMEHMENECSKSGFDSNLVLQIIAQTIVGAAKMIQIQGESPSVLREKITSPNGTTAAGLAELERFGGGKAISQAINKAALRSKEISRELEKSITDRTIIQDTKIGTGVIG